MSARVNSSHIVCKNAMKSIVLKLSLFLAILSYGYAQSSSAGDEAAAGHPKDDFSKYFIIYPQLHHARHKRALTNTLDMSGEHIQHITLTYRLHGKNVVADLKLNENLIPQGHFFRYQHKSGQSVFKVLNKTDVNLCHYQGAIRGKVNSYVAVSTCDGVNGLVKDGNDSYYIYSDTKTDIPAKHYIFRNSDIIQNATCGVISGNETRTHSHGIHLHGVPRHKRSMPENIIRGPYNANRHSSFVELVMVVDNKVYKYLGENMKKVHNHCKDIANIVNALYVPLNIFVALVGVIVWNEANEIELSSNGDDTLKNFLHYRRNLLKTFPNDNAQLLTKEQFEGGVVGKALKGPICTYEYSGGVSTEHSQLVAVVATTVAHEMGHNFGMEHDTADCSCVEEKCIMSASSTSLVPQYWSTCSVDQLNVAFSHGMNYCLMNKPKTLFNSPQCGNGFVEPGEQCDCGLPEYCKNSCCDPKTCMLHLNASCATGECCDLITCRPKSSGTECRPSEGECDLPEYCTGESEFCPQNVYKRDTEMCDNGVAYCYKGSCRSRNNQCRILWGPSGESSEQCYEKNIDGNRHGNCGYDRPSNQYIPCAQADIHCGMLHCKHLNERLEFGMESVAILSHSFMNYRGSIIPCRTAIIDLGLQSPDPGLAPNGSKCGDDKMCIDQKCVSVSLLRSTFKSCPNNCNGQGVCNSEGNCHCNMGFAPPDCSTPGQGGSVDSGPASNPSSRIGFTRAMYTFFLGIVPCIAIISFLTYYWKQNRLFQPTKSGPVSRISLCSDNMLPRNFSSGCSPLNYNDSTMQKIQLENNAACLHNSMFGKFKGFTLKPLPNCGSTKSKAGAKVALVHPVSKVVDSTKPVNLAPARAAPPVPHQIENKSICDYNASESKNREVRPVISGPVLEKSTCTAKELENYHQPIQNNDSDLAVESQQKQCQSKFSISDGRQRNFADGTLNRIASFLKNDKKEQLPRKSEEIAKLKPILNREKLKNIDISSPLPIADNSAPPSEKQLSPIQRSQSLRYQSSTERATGPKGHNTLHSRPKSIMSVRPKSPPPRPPGPLIGRANSSACELPKNKMARYNVSSENIYADVDETAAPALDSASLAKESNDRGSESVVFLGHTERHTRQPNSISGQPLKKRVLNEKAPVRKNTYLAKNVIAQPTSKPKPSLKTKNANSGLPSESQSMIRKGTRISKPNALNKKEDNSLHTSTSTNASKMQKPAPQIPSASKVTGALNAPAFSTNSRTLISHLSQSPTQLDNNIDPHSREKSNSNHMPFESVLVRKNEC